MEDRIGGWKTESRAVPWPISSPSWTTEPWSVRWDMATKAFATVVGRASTQGARVAWCVRARQNKVGIHGMDEGKGWREGHPQPRPGGGGRWDDPSYQREKRLRRVSMWEEVWSWRQRLVTCWGPDEIRKYINPGSQVSYCHRTEF